MSIVSLALFGAALIPSQDLLIFGGTIRPGVHESVDGRLVPLEPVEAMLVQDGWIVAVGEVGELRRQGRVVPELDLEGMAVIPEASADGPSALPIQPSSHYIEWTSMNTDASASRTVRGLRISFDVRSITSRRMMI